MKHGKITKIDSGNSPEDFLIFDGSNWVAKGGNEKIKVGTATRDLTLANGTQAITGIGFKPSAVLIVAVVNNTGAVSSGFSDGSTHTGIRNTHEETADKWVHSAGIIAMTTGSSQENNATISSFDSDGFTLSWVKANSPTGTCQIKFLAFR